MTFSVIADQIAGDGTVQIPCGPTSSVISFSIAVGIALAGTVASDGSFSAQTSTTQPSQLYALQLQGAVPTTSGGSWQGKFNFSSNDPSCPYNGSGTFSAVGIANLIGTYTGSGSFSPPSGSSPAGTNGNSQPVSFTFALQQGQSLKGSETVNEAVFAGTVQTPGAPCFRSGVIMSSSPTQPLLQSGLAGTKLLATFTMDDGSNLLLSANIEDSATSKLGVVNMAVSGGNCDGQFTGPFELTLQ